ncbi:MAG: DUF1540 domain-containing protein [Clostridiales bacterium]|jgi:hypothetical protein|nr:DUF1540 domain-containing protein [Clostridiales bacterium]
MDKDILDGITCEVKECKYNYDCSKCCAPSINVTGFSAKSTKETACDTFVKE